MNSWIEVSTISPKTTRIGWIGTGVMGKSMCEHLINAGYACTVVSICISIFYFSTIEH